MNKIITPKRYSLTSELIVSLVFISCIGPPVLFETDQYVKNILLFYINIKLKK